MPLLHIKDEDFAGVIADNPVVLVDFYADWCGPCKMVAPILEELAAEGHVIAKMDVDSEQEIPQRFAVSSIPTLLVFKDGVKVAQHVGYAGKQQIEELLK